MHVRIECMRKKNYEGFAQKYNNPLPFMFPFVFAISKSCSPITHVKSIFAFNIVMDQKACSFAPCHSQTTLQAYLVFHKELNHLTFDNGIRLI